MASSRITKQKINDLIEIKRKEILNIQDFNQKLKKTFDNNNIKIAELEGAILALHELLTGEKVK